MLTFPVIMLRIKHDFRVHILENQYVPLKSVCVEGKIHCFADDVTIKQIFRNCEIIPVEAVYCFPIENQLKENKVMLFNNVMELIYLSKMIQYKII